MTSVFVPPWTQVAWDTSDHRWRVDVMLSWALGLQSLELLPPALGLELPLKESHHWHGHVERGDLLSPARQPARQGQECAEWHPGTQWTSHKRGTQPPQPSLDSDP